VFVQEIHPQCHGISGSIVGAGVSSIAPGAGARVGGVGGENGEGGSDGLIGAGVSSKAPGAGAGVAGVGAMQLSGSQRPQASWNGDVGPAIALHPK